MHPRGYGNPEDLYRPQERMMQEPYQDQYQHPHHHAQHFLPEHASPSFHRPSSFHYPPPPRPPRPPFDNNLPPDAPPPEFPYPFYRSPPTHQSLYPPPPPQYGLPHPPSFEAQRHSSSAPQAYGHSPFGERSLSSSEYAYTSPTFGGHSHPSSEHAYARPAVDHTHSPSFPDHTSSFQENTPWILERASVAPLEPLPSSMDHPPAGVELPKGQLVRVFCKSSRSYNLAVKDGRLMMVEADSGNELQQWIRDDKYSIRVRDRYGHPAFMLINKASKKVLKHSKGKLQEVQLTYYTPDIQDDDLFWTESQDFGEGFKTLRMASDTLLNLSVGHGSSVEDGSPVILDTWHKKDNQLWKIFPL